VSELDWDDLRYFLHAARERSLAKAARRLGVKHTTVGRRLAALERALKTPLVLRGPAGLRLTPAGEALLPKAEDTARAVQAAELAVAEQRSRVRLAVPSGYTSLLTPGLGRLRAEHPTLVLELVSGARPVDLKNGEADLALRNGPITDPDLVARKVGTAGWSVYAAHDYLRRRGRPSSVDDLSGHDVVGYDAALQNIPAAQWLEARTARANVVLRSREMTDMLMAVTSGLGIGVLPCGLGDPSPQLERLTQDVIATRQISLVYLKEARASDNVRAVITYVTDVMKEHARLVSGTSSSRKG
jgi:DNA-binding transcriptional LysR family regulator